jgi:glycosyltransferase involved in cell wall biosynthesis
MAALAHGVAVLTVQGTATDALLAGQPQALELTPAGDLRAYALAAVRLAADRPGLRVRGEAGRRLYETQLDWPVIARRVSGALGGAAP